MRHLRFFRLSVEPDAPVGVHDRRLRKLLPHKPRFRSRLEEVKARCALAGFFFFRIPRYSPSHLGRDAVVSNQFEKDVLAELAAMNVALKQVLISLAKSNAYSVGEHRNYLHRFLENGLADLDRMTYLSIPPDEQEAFTDNAKQRYANLLGKIRI